MSANSRPETKAVRAAVAPREVLTFRLGAEEYAIELLKVQEIRSYEAPTHIANSPACVLGVLDLRGVIVPIVDLRAKFGFADPSFTPSTVTIILNVGAHIVGVVVDSVADVVELSADQVKPAPSFGRAFDTEYIMGIGAVGTESEKRMLIIVELVNLLASILSAGSGEVAAQA